MIIPSIFVCVIPTMWTFTYDVVVHTMAHELAHCVHRHHGDSFFELMRDILEEYTVFHGPWDESEEDSWFIFD